MPIKQNYLNFIGKRNSLGSLVHHTNKNGVYLYRFGSVMGTRCCIRLPKNFVQLGFAPECLKFNEVLTTLSNANSASRQTFFDRIVCKTFTFYRAYFIRNSSNSISWSKSLKSIKGRIKRFTKWKVPISLSEKEYPLSGICPCNIQRATRSIDDH